MFDDVHALRARLGAPAGDGRRAARRPCRRPRRSRPATSHGCAAAAPRRVDRRREDPRAGTSSSRRLAGRRAPPATTRSTELTDGCSSIPRAAAIDARRTRELTGRARGLRRRRCAVASSRSSASCCGPRCERCRRPARARRGHRCEIDDDQAPRRDRGVRRRAPVYRTYVPPSGRPSPPTAALVDRRRRARARSRHPRRCARALAVLADALLRRRRR